MTAAFDSQITGDDGQGTGYTGGQEQQGTGGHPAWQPFLEAVPQELHSKITPLLQDWDKGVNDRFQKVHSEYAPWKPIIAAAGDPDNARFALNLLETMQSNPQVIYDALKQKYQFDAEEASKGAGNGQGQGEPNNQDNPWESKYNQLEQQQVRIAEFLLGQRQAELEKEQDQQLDRELSALKAKHGEFHEPYVLSLMQAGKTAEQAVLDFKNFQEQTAKSYAPKPLIMGGGGGAPGEHFNPAKASDSQVNDVVQQMLKAAAAERNR